MVGTKAGGAKAAATNKALHGREFYARIGRIGGRNGSERRTPMNKKQLTELLIASLVALIALGAIIIALMIGSTIDGAEMAQQYDLECLTEPKTEPLKECKE